MESGATQKIPLYDVEDSALLERSGGSYFTLQEGGLEQPSPNSRVLQGSIEESNVSILQEMARMVEIQRVFENSQKAMLNYSTISEKTNEIGILA
jgi:flagellar basal body rod protein FlgG